MANLRLDALVHVHVRPRRHILSAMAVVVRPLHVSSGGTLSVRIHYPSDRVRDPLTKQQKSCRALRVHTRHPCYTDCTLPPDLGRLCVTELNVDGLASVTLDALLPNTDHLRVLRIDSMHRLVGITALPRHLTSLSLQWCQHLTSIPDLGALVTVRELRLKGVRVCPSALPPNLQRLTLSLLYSPSSEEYERFTRAVAAATALESFEFGGDRYGTTVTPPDTSMLPRLTELSLILHTGHNIPDHVFRCWQLRRLCIEFNTGYVPETIAQLRHLQYLSLIPYSPGVCVKIPPCLPAMPMLQSTDLRIMFSRDRQHVDRASALRRVWFARHAVLILCAARRPRRLPVELENMVHEQLQAWAPALWNCFKSSSV